MNAFMHLNECVLQNVIRIVVIRDHPPDMEIQPLLVLDHQSPESTLVGR
jgi:hypothetical protein